jgi:hypothetical protein
LVRSPQESSSAGTRPRQMPRLKLIVDPNARNVRPNVILVMGGEPDADRTGSATRSSRQHRVELHRAEINIEIFSSYAPVGSEFPFRAAAGCQPATSFDTDPVPLIEAANPGAGGWLVPPTRPIEELSDRRGLAMSAAEDEKRWKVLRTSGEPRGEGPTRSRPASVSTASLKSVFAPGDLRTAARDAWIFCLPLIEVAWVRTLAGVRAWRSGTGINSFFPPARACNRGPPPGAECRRAERRYALFVCLYRFGKWSRNRHPSSDRRAIYLSSAYRHVHEYFRRAQRQDHRLRRRHFHSRRSARRSSGWRCAVAHGVGVGHRSDRREWTG